LLVPLDTSVFGEQALPVALSIARRAGAAVHAVHVHVPLAAMYVETLSALESTVDPKLRDRERAYLDDVARRVADAAPVSLATALIDGPVVDAVQEYAAGLGCDLVV